MSRFGFGFGVAAPGVADAEDSPAHVTFEGPYSGVWFPSGPGVAVTFDLTGSGGTYDLATTGGGGAFIRHVITSTADDVANGFVIQLQPENDGSQGQTIVSRWNDGFGEHGEMIAAEHGQPGTGTGGPASGGNTLNYNGGNGGESTYGGSPGTAAGNGLSESNSVVTPGGGGSAGVAAGPSKLIITES